MSLLWLRANPTETMIMSSILCIYLYINHNDLLRKTIFCFKQTSAGNHSVYVTRTQNNTQKHVLLYTGDFYQLTRHQSMGRKNSHYAHICRVLGFSFFEGGTDREKEGRERCKHVSVPLTVPRPGPSVGKVAQWLSHDPWEEAVFLLRPRMEQGHRREQGTTHSWETQLLLI